MTVDLPSGPVELTSPFGSLAPVVQTLTPDDAQVVALQFKHSYGTLIVSSDRNDAALTIDGSDFGHPPVLVFLTPGAHKVFLTASNAPDDVAASERIAEPKSRHFAKSRDEGA
jgi:PEGA domain